MLLEKPAMHIDEKRMRNRIIKEFVDRMRNTIKIDSSKLIEKVIGHIASLLNFPLRFIVYC